MDRLLESLTREAERARRAAENTNRCKEAEWVRKRAQNMLARELERRRQ